METLEYSSFHTYNAVLFYLIVYKKELEYLPMPCEVVKLLDAIFIDVIV